MKKNAVEIFLLSIALLLVLVLLIVSNSSEGPSGPGWQSETTGATKTSAPDHGDHNHDEWTHGDEDAGPSSDRAGSADGKEW